MHHHQPTVTVAQFGVGPIGAEIARLILKKPECEALDAIARKVGGPPLHRFKG